MHVSTKVGSPVYKQWNGLLEWWTGLASFCIWDISQSCDKMHITSSINKDQPKLNYTGLTGLPVNRFSYICAAEKL